MVEGTGNESSSDDGKSKRTWALALGAAAVVVAVAVGGWALFLRDTSGLSSEDRAKADAVWDSQTSLEREALCAQLSDPETAAEQAKDLQASLTADAVEAASDDEALDALLDADGSSEQRAERLVRYWQGKC